MIYKRNCKICNNYYKGYGKLYCSRKCYGISIKGENSYRWNRDKNYCIDCKKQLKHNFTKRCLDCWHQFMVGSNNPNYDNHKMKMENNPNWRGGLSFQNYPKEFNRNLKNKILKRDNDICQGCWKSKELEYKNLSIHHIDYNKKNCNENNLITVCQSCNSRANFNKEYWQKYFQNNIDKLAWYDSIYKYESK